MSAANTDSWGNLLVVTACVRKSDMLIANSASRQAFPLTMTKK
jgi:hypothetical protein